MNRIRSLLLAGLVLTTGVRGILFATIVPGARPLGADVYAVWLVGFLNDVVVLALLALPVLLVRVTWPRATGVAVTGAMVVLLVAAMLDLFFWFEFGNRADRLTFHYLRFPVEVGYFLEDQFYLSLYVVPVVLLVFLLHRSARHVGRALLAVDRTWCVRIAGALAAVVAAVAILVPEPGPLRATGQRVADTVASHGLLDVIRAALVDEDAWQGVFPSLPEAERAALLEAGRAAAAAEALTTHAPTGHARHVVLVIEESFAGSTWWDPVARARFMPRYDGLRAAGVYFDALYATGSRTTRGLEAVLHGFPPLPGIALNQRPGVERLPSLPRALAGAGFDTLFVYGGWPGFSGFADYWRRIGFATVTSRDDFPDAGFETSWGVPDEMLFERVLEEMDARTATDQRVFLATLTVSNHRPFDFPSGRIDLPADARRLDYAIAYADWALGRFFDAAATRPWFGDTLFVVVPDHGPSPRAAGLVPVETYRVPGLLLWPAGLPPREERGVASLLDVPRTLLGLLGVVTAEPFFGRDLLAPRLGCAGAPVEYDYRPGIVTEAGLTVLERHRPPVSFETDSAGGWRRVATRDVEVRCAIALFETANERWLRTPASAGAP